jgi:hypothetical protein
MFSVCRVLGLAVGAMAFGLCTANAAEFNMNVTTADINLGKHVSGPELAKDELKHHVVFMEFWGVH